MDTGKIKALATGARVQLMDGVRASLERVLAPDSAESINEPGRVNELRGEAKDKEVLVERVAYTWFNRLCALRLMDSRGYTPVPVVTPRAGETMPAILADARRGVFCADFPLKPTDKQRVVDLLSSNTESVNPLGEAYVILLLSACDYYAKPIPALFGADLRSLNAVRLLAPTSLLADGSVLQRIVDGMDDENCKEVEVMGWLYQFYIAERKDEVFAGFKKNKKAGSKELAPATQLFTPHWIVRYMVENSLGRLWMLNYPDSELIDSMDYYVAPEKPEENYLVIDSPEDITFLDPAMGSGHILVYAFDLLYEMYIEEGYRSSEIPTLIFNKNLSGFEIDDRAAEIAIFALIMKARERDSDFFEHPVQPDITVFHSIDFDEYGLQEAGLITGNGKLLDALGHLDQAGSLYKPDPADAILLENAYTNLSQQNGIFAGHALGGIKEAANVTHQLMRRFSVVVANPPYMGSGNMNRWLNNWVRDNYPNEKSDLCTCFINRCLSFAEMRGYVSLITMQSWMFLGSYERMRGALLHNQGILGMAHLGARAFEAIGGEIVSTTATVFLNGVCGNGGTFVRVVDFNDATEKDIAFRRAISGDKAFKKLAFRARTDDFLQMPGTTIVYWTNEAMKTAFLTKDSLSSLGDFSVGIQTGDTKEFIRCWWEVSVSNINLKQHSEGPNKWTPYNKGGSFRKWYGNIESLINWKNNGEDIRRASEQTGHHIQDYRDDLKYLPAITWSRIVGSATSSGDYLPYRDSISFRLLDKGFLTDMAGFCFFPRRDHLLLTALLNSSTASVFLVAINPTTNCLTSDVSKVPLIELDSTDRADIETCANNSMEIAKLDYDSFETSWDYVTHPLIAGHSALNTVSKQVIEAWNKRFEQLRANEEHINSIFARVYGLEANVPIEVPDDKVSVRRFDRKREIRSLVSYAIGCMFGRYSLDIGGLILADQGSTVEDYLAKIPSPSFMPDEDGILPITEEEWFEDDIVTEFWRWLKAAFGEECFDENLAYIEEALGCKLREYFIKGKKSAFYDDHCKTYSVTGSGKRPIYWMFSSPKSSFNCLVYLHRYDDRTVSKILTDYVRELRRKLEIQARSLEASDVARDRTRAAKYHDMIDELNDWERDVLYPMAQRHIKIDLDDGVRHNYKLFPGALRKVTGLS